FKGLKDHYSEVLKSQQELQQDLQKRLEGISHTAKVFSEQLLQSSKTYLDTHSNEVISKYENLQEKIKESLDSMAKTYLKMLSLLTKESLDSPKNASKSFLETFNQLQSQLLESTNKTNLAIQSNRKSIDEMLKATKANIDSSLEQTSHLHENLHKSLEELDGALSKITLGFREDYDWFLRKIREFMGARN
ncbi:MAG: hypothetical protein K2I63_03480, partial [Helicobacter sp.]|nr:hypothetical protein [Helicobacter sp.]